LQHFFLGQFAFLKTRETMKVKHDHRMLTIPQRGECGKHFRQQ